MVGIRVQKETDERVEDQAPEPTSGLRRSGRKLRAAEGPRRGRNSRAERNRGAPEQYQIVGEGNRAPEPRPSARPGAPVQRRARTCGDKAVQAGTTCWQRTDEYEEAHTQRQSRQARHHRRCAPAAAGEEDRSTAKATTGDHMNEPAPRQAGRLRSRIQFRARGKEWEQARQRAVNWRTDGP